MESRGRGDDEDRTSRASGDGLAATVYGACAIGLSPASDFMLDTAGRCTRQDFSNTTYTLNTFDTANRITRIQTKNSSATVLSDIQYSYDGVNVTSRTDTDGTVTPFGYDASNQLTLRPRL